MRTKHILSILILTILIFASSKNFAQITFSLDPNIKVTSGHLGYKFEKDFVIFLGAENQKFDVYNTETAPNLRTEYISQEEVFILFLGTKIFVTETKNTKFYLKFSLGNTIFQSEFNLKDRQINSGAEGEKDNVSGISIEDFGLMQIKFGIGTEYFFSENFSFAGDIGGRTFLGSTEKINGDNSRGIDIDLSEFYSSLSFNFYF